MRLLSLPLLFSFTLFSQVPQTPPPALPVVSVSFPSAVLPAGLAGFVEFNQLGNPRFTGGFAAIYPLIGSLGIYGTTVTDFLPKLAADPATGKSFYAISAAVRQGFHKSIVATGPFVFLLGADVGPSISQSTTSLIEGRSAITVSFSTSVTATAVWQLNPTFSFILPVRMLYVNGIGWNPVVEAGFVVNLKTLPKAK